MVVTSTLVAVKREFLVKPEGTDAACNVNVSLLASNPVITTSPSKATGELPTNLISAFKSTLDEIIFSDLILHVRDISDKDFDNHASEVVKVLEEIGINSCDERIIEVFNKYDLLENELLTDYKINKKTTYNNITDKFELENYEKTIINNLVSEISDNIMLSISKVSE